MGPLYHDPWLPFIGWRPAPPKRPRVWASKAKRKAHRKAQRIARRANRRCP